MTTTISPIEEIKKYPVFALVPIAGVCWFLLSKYPGGILIARTDYPYSTLDIDQIPGIDLEALRTCRQKGFM